MHGSIHHYVMYYICIIYYTCYLHLYVHILKMLPFLRVLRAIVNGRQNKKLKNEYMYVHV